MAKTPTRHLHLKQILVERRREIQRDVRTRVRDGRANRQKNTGDDLEQSDAENQGDIDLMLLQMRADTLVRIDEALRRLDAGTYGSCAECGDEIAERRLRALPFAVRCQACEEQREQAQKRGRQIAQQRGALSLFPEVAGF
jgi:DnaK suppressor protein